MHYSTMQCNIMQCTSSHCTAMHCNAIQCATTHYNEMHCVILHCIIIEHQVHWSLFHSHLTDIVPECYFIIILLLYSHFTTLCTFVVIFLELSNSGPLPNHEVIEETDPYYWSIDESDMLSNFNHDETADHNTTADTMTFSANGYTPRPPVMCAQRVLDNIKIHKFDRFEMKSDMKA